VHEPEGACPEQQPGNMEVTRRDVPAASGR
jgi:hypothetical protein